MSFEYNPADEDRDAYDNGLMVEEIKSLKAQLAEREAEVADVVRQLMEAFSNARVQYELEAKPAQVWVGLRNSVAVELTTLIAAERAKWEATLRSALANAETMTASDDFERGRKSGAIAAVTGLLDALVAAAEGEGK